MLKHVISLILILFSFSACTTARMPSPAVAYQKTLENQESEVQQPVNPINMDKGYLHFKNKEFKEACPFFYKFISENSRDVKNYEWAEFFLGISLKECGLTHASVDILSFLVTRKPNTKIVSYTLELFEEISRTLPYDEEKVIVKAVSDHEYGFVDSDLKNFIHYHQGMFDWQNGFKEWGDTHFKMIQPESYYYYLYQFQSAMEFVYTDDIDSAIDVLTQINGASFQGDKLRNDTRRTLARLLYEKKEYAKADTLYESINSNIVYQAQNLLERAWAHYRMGNSEKAMGLLYAFKAPAYRNYFTPEYFLLKSLIYKDVCHYNRALAVIDEFKNHYQDSLQKIYARNSVAEIEGIIPVLLEKKGIKKEWDFLTLLENENKQIKQFKDPELKGYLEEIYALQMKKSAHDLKLKVHTKFQEVANEFLEYEEKTNLLAYEIKLDIYQRIYQDRANSREKSDGVGDDGYAKRYYVLYPFQGEFWNDELDNYKVTLNDKCSCMEEWDIFFK